MNFLLFFIVHLVYTLVPSMDGWFTAIKCAFYQTVAWQVVRLLKFLSCDVVNIYMYLHVATYTNVSCLRQITLNNFLLIF